MQKQNQDRTTTKRSESPTPIEKLLADKIELEAKCRLRETKLNEDFDYIRDNSSRLILSGLSSLLFPSAGPKQNKPEEQAVAVVGKNRQSQNNALLAVDNLQVAARVIVPAVWRIVRPVLIKWGINKVKSILIRTFTPKNRSSTAN